MSENTSIETIERDIPETPPEAGGLVGVTEDGMNDIIQLAEKMPLMIDAFNKIRLAILNLAQPGDWVLFESKGKGKAEIGFAGANRIGSVLGVNYSNWKERKESGADERGAWYRYEYECDASYKSRMIRVYGRAGTRDKFFGRQDGADKKLEQIKEDDIKIAAMRAAKKEGVRDLFGLHHMDPEFLKKHGIVLDSAGGHSFKGQDQSAAEAESVSLRIVAVTFKSGTNKNGKAWTKYTIADAAGVGYSTFSETMAKEAKRAKETNETATITFKKGDYGPELLSINGITDSNGR